MKMLSQIVLIIVFLFGCNQANAAPTLTLTANGYPGFVRGTTNTIFNIRLALNADNLIGLNGKFSILMRNTSNKGLAPFLSYYTKGSESLVGGVWANQVANVINSYCVKNIPATTIFYGKLPEGTYEFIYTLSTTTTQAYQKSLVVYVYGSDIIQLVSSTLLPDKRRQYNYRIMKKGFEEPIVAPYIMGDFNKFQVQDLKDIDYDRNYEFSITSFNTTQSFIFGSDHAADVWGKIDFSRYYDPTRALLLVDQIDGAIFQTGVKPIVVPAGTDRIIRFDAYNPTTKVLGTWLNLKEITGSVSAPFHFGTYNTWKQQSFNAIIGSGWAKCYISVLPNSEFRLAYGGNFSTNSWANASLSKFWDPVTKSLKIKMVNGVPTKG